MRLFKAGVVVMMIVIIGTAGAVMAGTLDEVKARGYIQVGVNEGLFGFSKIDRRKYFTESFGVISKRLDRPPGRMKRDPRSGTSI